MTVAAEELILCAEKLIKSSEPLDQRITRIAAYAKDFDLWYASFEEHKTPGDVPIVERLLALHNELITTAERWLKEAGSDIGRHKQKSKAIRAYADVLPKRVSRYRVKKG